MKMKRILFACLLLSTAMSTCGWAGEWVQFPNYDYEYRDIWKYREDDGTWAAGRWIQDQGSWYWLQEDETLPSQAGYAPDGFCFNAKGEYIDLADGRQFVTRELARQIQVGMSYSEITSILGIEHEETSASQTTSGLRTFRYRTLKWYSRDLKYSLIINFTNDVSDSKSSETR